MQQTISNLSSVLVNSHIKWTLVAAVGLEIAAVFLPQHKDKLMEVQKILIGYGIIAASNSAPQGSNNQNKQ